MTEVVCLPIKPRQCERCGKKHLRAYVWLELDTITNTFHAPGDVQPDRSQGLFAFGVACARRTLEQQGRTS